MLAKNKSFVCSKGFTLYTAANGVLATLEFRDSNKDALARFRIEMGRVVTEVEGNFWDEDFYRKIVDIIDSKVKPAMRARAHFRCGEKRTI